MTTEEIQKRVIEIQEIARDDEAAHAREDELRDDFIAYVASLSKQHPGLAKKAKLVLSTSDIELSRWCA